MSRQAPEWDFFLACGDALHDAVSELHRDLSRKARVFSPALDLRPGDDTRRVVSQALRDAGIVVLLLGRGADLDHTLGDELQRAVARRRSDPTRPFVPLYLDAHAERHPLYGTATTQGLALHGLGRETVVRKLHDLAISLRAQWNARARVAVVSVEAELGDVARAVAERLAALTVVDSVTVIDAARPDALMLARKADLSLVLVGVRTGRTSALRELIEGGAPALKLAQVDPSRIVLGEFVEAQSLHAKIDARESFLSAEEAAGRAQDALATWLKTWAAASPGGGPALEPWERAWLEARRTKWRAGSHEGLREASRGRSLDRARLYVSLRAEATESMHVAADGQLVVRDRADENSPLERMRGEGKLRAPWLESLVSHRALPTVAVEAEAGSGKTVLVQHVACVLAAMHLGEPVAEHHLDRGALEEGAPLLRVPVLIEARRIAEFCAKGTPSEIFEALARIASEFSGHEVAADTMRDALKAGRYLLLIDSLDEVAGTAERERLLQALDALVACRWPFRLVLTTRPTAHTGAPLPDALRVVRIARLDGELVAKLIARWADAMGEDERYRADVLDAITHLREREGGAEGLTGNPLLLTCALLVYDQQRLLPDSLAELYERMVQILCRARVTDGAPTQVKRELLERVCEAMQRAGSTALDVRDAAEVVLGVRPELRTVDAASALLDRLAADTGLFRFETTREAETRRERRVVRPWHRSFQEFLAACQLASSRGSVAEETDRLLVAEGSGVALALDPAWEGALGFLVGVYGNQGSDRARSFVARLTDHALAAVEGFARVSRPGRLLGVAARGVAEYRDFFKDGALREKLRRVIVEEFEREGAAWPWRDRILALEALGRLVDPRLDWPLWVEIPGGEFTFGEEGAFQSVSPRRVKVDTFWMAWRPVTFADYVPFVAAGGYREPAFWEGVPANERYDEPEGWGAQRFHPNRPVVGVSHHEAVAWCRWASATRGELIELPREVEWEYAARGTAGDVFPWGGSDPGREDEARANYGWDEDSVGSASPVGAFPRGNRGPLVDLAGNVWEWCSDEWSKEGVVVKTMTRTTKTAEVLRILRGGAWNDPALDLRCASRLWGLPWRRSPVVGFRVVVRGFGPRTLGS